MATTLGGVEIPKVYVQETERRILGGEIIRAVDGTPHVNSVKRIRTWQLETRAITFAQFQSLQTVYDNAGGGQVAFHLDEWEGGFVYVYIIDFPDERTLIPDGNGKSMHTIRITLKEA